MRSTTPLLRVLGLLVIVACIVALGHAAGAHAPSLALALAFPTLMGSIIQPPASFAQLAGSTTPPSGTSTDTQAWMFYDTQLITSGTTVKLQFFTATNADKTMSNFLGANQLPSPQYFSIYSFGFTPFFKPQLGTTNLGALTDAYELLYNQRGIWEFTLSDKKVGPFPLSAAHADGGPVGGVALADSAIQVASYASNGTFDGGFVVDNAIIIPPQTGFELSVSFAAAPALTANLNIRAWMYGTLWRKTV
jgi:hypothetical protein